MPHRRDIDTIFHPSSQVRQKWVANSQNVSLSSAKQCTFLRNSFIERQFLECGTERAQILHRQHRHSQKPGELLGQPIGRPAMYFLKESDYRNTPAGRLCARFKKLACID